jgi:hypothetical protein
MLRAELKDSDNADLFEALCLAKAKTAAATQTSKYYENQWRLGTEELKNLRAQLLQGRNGLHDMVDAPGRLLASLRTNLASLGNTLSCI